MLIKIKVRHSVQNYKKESSVTYEDTYINLDNVRYAHVFGSVVRICFSQYDYIECDFKEWDKIINKII